MTEIKKYREGNSVRPLARTLDEWRAWAESVNARAFHGNQIFKWIHCRQQLNPDAMTDLPTHIRSTLSSEFQNYTPTVDKIHEAADGTRKIVFSTSDAAKIEAVLIPFLPDEKTADQREDWDQDEAPCDDPASVSKDRVTMCISTQVGCAIGCSFCASGARGLIRHLQPDEIIAQVLIGKTLLHPHQRLSNVVLMGIGEPLHNYDATVRAVRLMQHDEGLGLSSRRITISTAGLVPELNRLGNDFQGRIGLAVSLHAADDAVRSSLIPINRQHPIGSLMMALRSYPLPPRRTITVEYALMDGVNDSEKAARSLVRLLRGIRVKVNLIPMNPVVHSSLRPSPPDRVAAFQQI
ncbi:MAG: 23S rRNA (adenine(2503)-C(2))-methyltransferase RlmN, partial [Polyangiaceae bacterium]|nr:23S rRNA (adenine(2503)-C(2))-methyltransferase RlmN [Polyangiaceae bacterium]